MRRVSTMAVLVIAVITAFAAFSSVANAASQRVIVVLASGSDPVAAARRHAAQPTHVYRSALRGYAAVMSDAAIARARRDSSVAYIAADRVMTTFGKTPSTPAPQVVPTGILRIGSALSRRDGIDTRTDVDVAVIDTGIDTAHPDLKVAGGRNCSSGTSYADGNGHGTHVAGTIGAIDNATGVVGVAPGARLWAVRVLNNAGSGSTSSVICGIDWVTANAATIEVANLSLGGAGTDDGNCGNTNNDPMHQAICRSVNAGVTYVVAAGNDNANAALSTPAAYDEVITVSAWADFNGAAGGGAAATCRTDVDDSFASFSNWGSDVDIAAPGVCIRSTWKGKSYNTISGTSMATPHVSGAAALYAAANPGATPAGIRAALLSQSDMTAPTDDPDGTWEGLLSVLGWL